MSADSVNLIVHYKYLVLVFLGIVEGPIVMILAGLLVKLGYLALLPTYLALVVGDLAGDIVWYLAGYCGGQRFVDRWGKYFSITNNQVLKVESFFHRHQDWILVLSKVTMGFGFALVTLITAGLVRIPFPRFLLLSVAGQLIWSGLLLAIGYYFFGRLYGQISGLFWWLSLGAIMVMIAFLLAGYRRYLRGRLGGEKLS